MSNRTGGDTSANTARRAGRRHSKKPGHTEVVFQKPSENSVCETPADARRANLSSQFETNFRSESGCEVESCVETDVAESPVIPSPPLAANLGDSDLCPDVAGDVLALSEDASDGRRDSESTSFQGYFEEIESMPDSTIPNSSLKKQFRGRLERVDASNGAVGWITDDDCSQLEVELIIDGIFVNRALADRERPDLVEAGIGNGRHGFSLPVDPVFLDGLSHEIEVRVAGTDMILALPTPKSPIGVAPPLAHSSPKAPGINRSVEISVIMPTFNRGEIMERSVSLYLDSARKIGAELIVIDDGSRDDTPDRLKRLADSAPNLVTERIPNGGPARARNLGASMARGRVLVFVGDDVCPVDSDFLKIHATAHAKLPKVGHAVLGKISWPDADQLPVSFLMSHIQGEGEQQFGYRSMRAYHWYDWPLFYSSNVSVKKSLVDDWLKDGFDTSFYLAAFEDAEFAYRATTRLEEEGDKFGVLYVPAAEAVHFHPYTVAGFISRQNSAGMMAQRFLELHPSCACRLGLADLRERLAVPRDATPFPLEHYFALFEGLKSWALVIENHYGLGHKNWHSDLLRAVFELAYLEGFLRAQNGRDVNLAAGCRYILETVRSAFNRAIVSEVFGDLPGFGLV